VNSSTYCWEVRGDKEGELVLEWSFDLGFLAIHGGSSPPSSAKNVDAPKIFTSTLGDNHLVRTLRQLLFHLEWWLRQGMMGPVSQ